MPEPLQVTAAEAGQKLLQFLSRRFEEPQSVLHRWIRTGQVRINGGRAKPFDRVELNDEIRVPPFAGAGTKAERVPASSGGKELPPIVAETADVIVFCKPSGLPVHPGTGHTDSLTTRLEAAFAGSPFIPAPVHRLDRDTSGLLLTLDGELVLDGLTLHPVELRLSPLELRLSFADDAETAFSLCEDGTAPVLHLTDGAEIATRWQGGRDLGDSAPPTVSFRVEDTDGERLFIDPGQVVSITFGNLEIPVEH